MIEPADYVASPRTTDPVKLLREREIANRELRRIIAEQDTELADRQALVNQLLAEQADNA